MKIMIAISDSFCANFIKGQGKYLVENGHEVIVVSGPGVEIDLLEKNEPIKVIRYKFAREISLIKDIKSLFAVIKIVIKEKPDIINAGNPKTGFLFSLAHIFFWRIPLIFTLRGIRSDTLLGFKRTIVKITEKITCLFSNRIIAISPSLKDHAVSLGLVSDNKCLVLSQGSSNGIDISRYTRNSEIIKHAKSILENLDIPINSFKLLFVGRVTKDKGLIELIDALRICNRSYKDIHLIIAGPIENGDPLPDEYYDILHNYANIHYIGKQIDVRPIYAFADALVLYSYREGFGNVVIEASSMKLPTIVSDIPGLRDTTIHKVTGLLVEPQNSVALSNSILQLYSDPSLRIKYGENGRKRILQYFSNEIVWSKQNELYKQLCK